MPSTLSHAEPLPNTDRVSTGRRTIVSVLLFLHLLALAIGILTNFGPVSPLRAALNRVPLVEPYLQLLDMDLAYNFHLTYGEALDVDHQLEAEIAGSNGQPAQKVTLPPPGIWPKIRDRRYRMLGYHVAAQVQNDALESTLPKSIGESLLVQHGASRLTFRCIAHQLQSTEDVAATDPARSNPNGLRFFSTVYEALIFGKPGAINVMKQEIDRDAAPAAETAGAGAASGDAQAGDTTSSIER